MGDFATNAGEHQITFMQNVKPTPKKIVTIDKQKYELVSFYYGFDKNGNRKFVGYLLKPEGELEP